MELHPPFRVHRHPHCNVPGSLHHLHGYASGPRAAGASSLVASTTRVTASLASNIKYVPELRSFVLCRVCPRPATFLSRG